MNLMADQLAEAQQRITRETAAHRGAMELRTITRPPPGWRTSRTWPCRPPGSATAGRVSTLVRRPPEAPPSTPSAGSALHRSCGGRFRVQVECRYLRVAVAGMKRRLFMAGFFLLSGLLANIAVAWTCIAIPARTTKRYDIRMPLPPDDSSVQWWLHNRPPEVQDGLAHFSTHGHPGWRVLHYLGRPATGHQQWHAVRYIAGTPVPCVHGELWRSPVCHATTLKRDGLWQIKLASGSAVQLPFRPMWTGMLIDTPCYAALLWWLVRGPLALRRVIRIRRGLCPACSYPSGESPLCTECGRQLPRRLHAA